MAEVGTGDRQGGWRSRVRSPWSTTLIAFGLSQAVILAGSLIRIPLITHALGEVGYGTFVTITSVWPAVQILANGLSSTARVVVAERPSSVARTVHSLRATGLREGAAVLLLAVVLLPVLGPTVGWGFAWSVLWVGAAAAVSLPTAAHQGVLEGSGRTATAHLALTATTVVGLPVLILALGLRQDLTTVVAASMVGFVAPYLACLVLSRLLVRVPEDDGPPVLLTGLSGAMTGWALSNVLVFVFDPVILFTAVGAAEAGQYGLATRVTGLVTVLPVGLGGLLAVWFSRARTTDGGSSVHRKLLTSTALFSVAGAVLAAVCILVGPWLGDLLSRGSVQTPRELYLWLGIYGGLTCATEPLVAAWAAPLAAGVRARVGVTLGVVNVLLSFLLATVLGVIGPVVATVVCNTVVVSVLGVLSLTRPHLIRQAGGAQA